MPFGHADGQPSHGSVVGRTPDQARVFGKLDMADNVGLAAFLSVDASPVGMAGRVLVSDASGKVRLLP